MKLFVCDMELVASEASCLSFFEKNCLFFIYSGSIREYDPNSAIGTPLPSAPTPMNKEKFSFTTPKSRLLGLLELFELLSYLGYSGY